LEFADINPCSTRLCPDLLQVDVNLIPTLLHLVDIRTQCHDVEVNTVGDSTVGLEFTTDVLILTVSAVDIAILVKDGRSEFEHMRVKLIHAVMKMEEGQFGARRCSFASRWSRARHGGRGAGGTGVTSFKRGNYGHDDSVIIMVV
jgi:hypothetical protein